MSFVTACVHPAHIFVSSLLNWLHTLHRVDKLWYSEGISSDPLLWLNFLPQYNGISTIPPPSFPSNILVTDACSHSVGSYFKSECFHAALPDFIATDPEYNINVKELCTIIAAFRIWGPTMNGSCLLIKSDNLDAVIAINSRQSCSPLIQQCIGVLWYLCAVYGFDIQSEHIPGYKNIYADLLSGWSSDHLAKDNFFLLYQVPMNFNSKIALQVTSISVLISLHYLINILSLLS